MNKIMDIWSNVRQTLQTLRKIPETEENIYFELFFSFALLVANLAQARGSGAPRWRRWRRSERLKRFHKRQRRFAKKFLAELRAKDEDLLPSEKHQELMLQEEPLPVRFRCTGHPQLGKDAPSSPSMKVAMAFYLTHRGPGQAAGRPNFGRLVLGCIDAEFFK